MRIRLITLLPMLMLLSGCSGLGYVMENYEDVPLEKFRYRGHTYRIFDNEMQSKLMITPSLSASLGQGAIQGLTLNSINASPPKPVYQAVAEAYLRKRYGNFQILDGYEVLDPQWEFLYRLDSR